MTEARQPAETNNVLHPTRVVRVVSYSLLCLLLVLLLALDNYAHPEIVDWLRHHDSADPSSASLRHAIIFACLLAIPPVLALATGVYLTPHPLYRAIGRDDTERQAAYRDLFRAQLDSKAIDDIRLAINQKQPLGNSRFYAKVEATTGQRREAKPRGRPRVQYDESPARDAGQGELGL